MKYTIYLSKKQDDDLQDELAEILPGIRRSIGRRIGFSRFLATLIEIGFEAHKSDPNTVVERLKDAQPEITDIPTPLDSDQVAHQRKVVLGFMLR